MTRTLLVTAKPHMLIDSDKESAAPRHRLRQQEGDDPLDEERMAG